MSNSKRVGQAVNCVGQKKIHHKQWRVSGFGKYSKRFSDEGLAKVSALKFLSEADRLRVAQLFEAVTSLSSGLHAGNIELFINLMLKRLSRAGQREFIEHCKKAHVESAASALASALRNSGALH